MMRVLDKIKGFFMAIPFGMKAGDDILTTSNTDVDGGDSIHQQVEHKSIWNDLLKGELTQEVEELRYETFKSEEMSNEYQYIGNGQATKKEGTKKTILNKRKKFFQYNTDQEYGIMESLEMLNNKDDRLKDDWKKRKIFKITYNNNVVKFRLENHVEKIMVDLTGGKNRTLLYFVDDKLNRDLRPLVNFLKKTKKDLDAFGENELAKKTYKSKNEICSDLSELKFTTLNATNDVPNGIDYNFKKPKFIQIKEENGYVILEYEWKEFDGNVLLSERFKSKTGEEKIKNKEKREGYIPRAGIKQGEDEDFVIRNRDAENLDSWLNEEEIKGGIKNIIEDGKD